MSYIDGFVAAVPQENKQAYLEVWERTLPALEAAHIRPRANHDDGLITNAAGKCP
jgi:hypothetical protein